MTIKELTNWRELVDDPTWDNCDKLDAYIYLKYYGENSFNEYEADWPPFTTSIATALKLVQDERFELVYSDIAKRWFADFITGYSLQRDYSGGLMLEDHWYYAKSPAMAICKSWLVMQEVDTPDGN